MLYIVPLGGIGKQEVLKTLTNQGKELLKSPQWSAEKKVLARLLATVQQHRKISVILFQTLPHCISNLDCCAPIVCRPRSAVSRSFVTHIPGCQGQRYGVLLSAPQHAIVINSDAKWGPIDCCC